MFVVTDVKTIIEWGTKKWSNGYMKLLNIILLFLLTGCSHIVPASDVLEEAHIIDWHVHVAGLGFGDSGNFVNDETRNNFRFNFFLN